MVEVVSATVRISLSKNQKLILTPRIELIILHGLIMEAVLLQFTHHLAQSSAGILDSLCIAPNLHRFKITDFGFVSAFGFRLRPGSVNDHRPCHALHFSASTLLQSLATADRVSNG